jgi:hypothetical protein
MEGSGGQGIQVAGVGRLRGLATRSRHDWCDGPSHMHCG